MNVFCKIYFNFVVELVSFLNIIEILKEKQKVSKRGKFWNLGKKRK